MMKVYFDTYQATCTPSRLKYIWLSSKCFDDYTDTFDNYINLMVK